MKKLLLVLLATLGLIVGVGVTAQAAVTVSTATIYSPPSSQSTIYYQIVGTSALQYLNPGSSYYPGAYNPVTRFMVSSNCHALITGNGATISRAGGKWWDYNDTNGVRMNGGTATVKSVCP